MVTGEWNRHAIERVMEDAERTLELLGSDEIPGNRDLALAAARQNYANLVRRSGRLFMTEKQHATLQALLDRLKARLLFFEESARTGKTDLLLSPSAKAQPRA